MTLINFQMIFNSQTPRLQEALESLKWALVEAKKINAITDARHNVTKSDMTTFGKPEIILYIFFLIIKKYAPFMDSFFLLLL